MKVAVDMDAMRFTHVHTVSNVVHGLVYLEGAKLKTIHFECTDRPGFLSSLTTLELNLLYRNTTGQDFPANLDDLTRREVLAELVEGMTPRDVVEAELDAQIEAVIDQLEAPIATATQFKYVKGALRPMIDDGGLFPLSSKPLTGPQLTSAAQQAPQRRAAPAAPTPAPAPALRAQPARSAPRAHAGSVRPKIWAVADRMWEAAGKPTDKTVVLALRKEMMAELETQGVKRTSSSTALGEWQKERLG